ncbi:GNAT family N-acetyltransferase [Ureibacillus sp. Re31]|uniref:GNAT family N-acetyltransferase n=1 Tax=Ureibacillus galli TaxID=2762222 RepID=A0ABR8XAQ8_9BACL|nr:GNAT family N-acetyltransferase [Ureibacillus galli]MBD8026278.1 GNAT family N-acetyltransferase [Ureibacillus galli]
MDIKKPNDFELKKVLSLSPQAIFDGTLGEVQPTEEKINQLVKPLLEKGSYYLIATEGNQLMGWILLGPNKDSFTDVINGFIYELFVLNEFRGNGISKQLMNAGIEHLKQDGYSEIRLSAFVDNQAIKLYEKLGFDIKSVTMSLKI